MEIPHIARELRDDATLLTLIRRGDETAMAALYDRYAIVVYSVLLRVLHHSSSAEEILEEMFVEIWRRPEEFLSVRGGLGAWLAVMARNRAIAALRRRSVGEMVADISLASTYDLSNEAERSTLAERTRAEVAKLSAEQRRIFAMAFFDGLSHTEIAEITGEAATIVKLRIRDALLSLRRGMLG
jgi:RNA polymerase sigma-70 factor (ECF subfamily)